MVRNTWREKIIKYISKVSKSEIGIFEVTLLYLILFLVSNFIIYFFSPALSSGMVTIGILLRDIGAILIIFLILLTRKRIAKRIQLFMIILFSWFAYVMIRAILSEPSFSSIFYIRSTVYIWIFFLLGHIFSTGKKERINKLVNFFAWSVIFYGLTALIIHFGRTWLISCYKLALLPEISLRNMYNDNFCVMQNAVSFDFYRITGKLFIRLYGLLIDPPLSGIFLSLSGLILFIWKSKYKILMILPVMALFLTISKGGLFIFTLTIITVFILKILKKQKNGTINYYKMSLIFLPVFLIICIISLFAFYKFIPITSIQNHFAGLESGFKLLQYYPLGLGIGEAGNFADVRSSAVGESYFGALIAQLGLPALILYVLITIYPILLLIKFERLKNSQVMPIFVFMFYYFISSYFSESSIAITVGSWIFFLYGFTYSNMLKFGYYEEKKT